MTFRAATRCWGLALVLGTALPLAAQSTPSASPKPTTPAYAAVWTAPLSAPAPIHLSADGSLVFALDANQALAAFAADDGRVIWTVPDISADVRLSSGGGRLYVFTPVQPEHDGQPQKPGRMDAFDVKDGRRVWTVSLESNPTTDPLAVTNAIFVAGGRQLREHAITDGTVVWQQSFDAAVTAMAASDERLFIALANQTLISIDRRTHARVTDVPLDAGVTTLVAAGTRLFICGEDGSLAAYRQDRSDAPLWRVLRAEPIGRPVVDDRHVYVAEFDNTARAYDVGNGTERWRLRLESRPRPGVQIAAGRVYFPMLSGAIAVATAGVRNGQPSGMISIGVAESGSASRLEWGGVTPDSRLLFRATRPSTHPAWTLTAAKRKDAS